MRALPIWTPILAGKDLLHQNVGAQLQRFGQLALHISFLHLIGRPFWRQDDDVDAQLQFVNLESLPLNDSSTCIRYSVYNNI